MGKRQFQTPRLGASPSTCSEDAPDTKVIKARKCTTPTILAPITSVRTTSTNPRARLLPSPVPPLQLGSSALDDKGSTAGHNKRARFATPRKGVVQAAAVTTTSNQQHVGASSNTGSVHTTVPRLDVQGDAALPAIHTLAGALPSVGHIFGRLPECETPSTTIASIITCVPRRVIATTAVRLRPQAQTVPVLAVQQDDTPPPRVACTGVDLAVHRCIEAVRVAANPVPSSATNIATSTPPANHTPANHQTKMPFVNEEELIAKLQCWLASPHHLAMPAVCWLPMPV